PSKTTNSATEFDTELFQTDICELSQELPRHADDSNPVQDDNQDFSPEYAITFRKSRDKRKRKTPKFTAVNQQKPSQPVTQHRSPKHQLLLYQREQTTRINPTKKIPINMSISSQPRSPSTKLHTINHKLQHSILPEATLTRKHNTRNLLAVNNKSKSSILLSTNYCLQTLILYFLYLPLLCLPIMYTHPILVLSTPLKILYNLPLLQSNPHSFIYQTTFLYVSTRTLS
ncbi:unnamed protein product, partial [Hymenolepis diminuta]